MKLFVISRSILIQVLLILALTACSHSDDDSPFKTQPGNTQTNKPDNAQVITTTGSGADDSYDIYVPEGLTINSLLGDFDGGLIFGGTTLTTTESRSVSVKPISDREVTGFIAQVPALNSETNAQQVFDNINTKLTGDVTISSIVSTGKQIFTTSDAVLVKYELTYSSMIKPTDLANYLVQLLGTNTAGGTISGLPVSAANEADDNKYTLTVGIIFIDSTSVIISVTVVQSDLAEIYSHVSSAVTGNSNVRKAGEPLAPMTDTFTGQSGSGLADFLFVIDDSRSMTEEQTAISSAATAFEQAIVNSGLDFTIATITTGSTTALRDTSGNGGITTDIAEFKQDVVPGTGGSATETGIWNAEQALSASGTVTSAGMPRANASLSVIIMSDERSQYTSRSGSQEFDPASNIFVDNNYIVYSIIDPSHDALSQYDDIAASTGGLTSDITIGATDPAVYEPIMTNIAENAGGATSTYILSQSALETTISVSVNGTVVVNNKMNGWTYSGAALNSIVFHGSAIPATGDSISVSYQY
jgi:hypothetical protein